MALTARTLKGGRVVYWACIPMPGRKPVWRKAGSVKGEAVRLEKLWREQAKAGTLDLEALGVKPTVRAYLGRWLSKRTNRGAEKDGSRFRLYVEPRAWFLDLKLEEVRPMHIRKLVDEIRVSAAVSDKTISHVVSLLHTMYRDAIIEELAFVQPVVLPRKTLRTARKTDPSVYQPGQAVALMRNQAVRPEVRILWSLLFYTGMRKGEAVGRRWRDCEEAAGLKLLRVRDQYDGQPLKTETPRVVPIHPELERALEWWASTGWEAVNGRKPRPEDFIVPNPRTRGVLSDHASYELLYRSAKAVSVPWHGVHSTRHTFVTMARRSGAAKEDYERITHNARGDIVDGYTRTAWEPLCAVVRGIDFDGDQRMELIAGIQGKTAFLSPPSDGTFPTDSRESALSQGLRSPSAPPQKPLEKRGQKSRDQFPVNNFRKRRENNDSGLTPALWALADTANRFGILPKEVA